VLYYDADGSGSKAAIEMATFTNNKALKSFGYKLDFGHFWRVMWERRAAKRTMR